MKPKVVCVFSVVFSLLLFFLHAMLMRAAQWLYHDYMLREIEEEIILLSNTPKFQQLFFL